MKSDLWLVGGDTELGLKVIGYTAKSHYRTSKAETGSDVWAWERESALSRRPAERMVESNRFGCKCNAMIPTHTDTHMNRAMKSVLFYVFGFGCLVVLAFPSFRGW
jgi:hypothetical protein